MEEQQIVQMLVSGNNDLIWFESNLSRLLSDYSNKFVAFRDGTVLGADSNLDNLLQQLENKGIDVSNVFIKFVSRIKSIL